MSFDVGSTPQLSAPGLAAIYRQIAARPAYLADQPLEVDEPTWTLGFQEMSAINKARGFALPTAPIDRVNFLLRGVPVVIKDEA